MQKEFSRRDFLKGMAVVKASRFLVACGGGGGWAGAFSFSHFTAPRRGTEMGLLVCSVCNEKKKN